MEKVQDNKKKNNTMDSFYLVLARDREISSNTKQFARIHTSSLIKIEKILNRPITKFYNSDDVNVIAAELRLTKTRPASLHKRHNLL